MTRQAAQELYEQLGAQLRYGDKTASEIDPDDWQGFLHTIRGAINGEYS